MNLLLFFPFAIAFLVSFFATKFWIKRARKAGLLGKDMNKYSKPLVPEAGGIAVVSGFVFAVLFYIGLKTFYFKTTENLISILALLSTVLLITIIGFTDDILGWKIGLRRSQKPLLCLIAAIPLMVINAGESIITLPLIGPVSLGLLYPLLLVPIGISGAANGFDMLAGYNGLEVGLGIIILVSLAVIVFPNATWLTLIAFCMVFSLLAFLFFNKHPSKVFPGNSLTYPVGALIACIAILGNAEKPALLLFIPFFLELLLKARGKLLKESFGKPNKDNSIEMPYKKIYGLEHLAILLLKKIKPSHKAYEKEVTYCLWLFQFIIAIIVVFRII